MPRIVSFIVLVAIVLLIGGLFFHVIAGFLLPLFLALILVVIFRPLFLWFVKKCRGRERIAAALTTATILLIVLIPLSLILTFAVIEAAGAVANAGRSQFRERFSEIRERFGLALPEELRPANELAASLDGSLPLADPQTGPQAVAGKLQNELDQLYRRLRPAPAEEAAVEADWLLDDAMAAFKRETRELMSLDPGDEAVREAAADVQQAYYMLVRPRMVEVLSETRVEAWLILQANPSREHLNELRQQAIEGLGVDLLGPLALSTGQSLGRFLFGFIIGIVVMTVSLYYFLADGPVMVKSLMRLAPLDSRYVEQLLLEFDSVSRAVVVATLLAALLQGVLGGFGYYLADLEAVFLLSVLTMFLALIPFVGATAVWLPCSLWLAFYEQRPLAGIALAAYGVLIVSTVDNFIKPLILHGQSNIHPLLALLSVLGGVRAMGPIGVFVGPMAVAFLQALLNMLRMEILELGKPRPPEAPTDIPL